MGIPQSSFCFIYFVEKLSAPSIEMFIVVASSIVGTHSFANSTYLQCHLMTGSTLLNSKKTSPKMAIVWLKYREWSALQILRKNSNILKKLRPLYLHKRDDLGMQHLVAMSLTSLLDPAVPLTMYLI